MEQDPAININKEVTTAKQWKNKTSSGAPLELPSGNMAQIRRISMQTYLKQGRIPNVLMAPVQKALQSGGDSLPEEDLKEVMQDPKALEQLFSMIDMVTCDAFVEPQVHPEPFIEDKDENGAPTRTPAERNDELLYVDEVDLDDKMFVFQWMVGGTSDLEPFRNQSKGQLDTVRSS